MLYAKLEENHGLGKRAISIYERATEAVLPEERYDVYLTNNLNFIILSYRKPSDAGPLVHLGFEA